MILVLLGTFMVDFSRPLVAIEKIVQSREIDNNFIVQAGHTKFRSSVLEIRTFIEPSELDDLYVKAELIITHAGVGSILKGIRMRKKIIAIPRLSKYSEHVDDHQLDILNEFENRGYLIPWKENDNIATLIENAKLFVPQPFVSNRQDLEQYLIDYIEKLP